MFENSKTRKLCLSLPCQYHDPTAPINIWFPFWNKMKCSYNICYRYTLMLNWKLILNMKIMSFGNLHQQLLLLAQLDTTLVGGIPIFLRSNKNIEVNNPVVIQHFLLNKKWNGDQKFFFVLCNICLIGCFIQKSYYFRHII